MPSHPTRPALVALFALLATGLATAASAQELRYGARLQALWNSNFRSTVVNQEDAFSFRLGPTLALADPHGRFTYDVEYRGDYEWFVDVSGADAWTNVLRADVGYAIGPRTQLRLGDWFRDTSSLRFSRGELEDDSSQVDPLRDAFLRNAFDWSIEHSLSRRLSLVLGGDHDWIDFQDNFDRSDSQSMGAQGQLAWALTPADRVGVGAGYAYQSFEASGRRLGSRANIVHGFVSWVHSFSEDARLSLQGGPSWVRAGSDAGASEVRAGEVAGVDIGDGLVVPVELVTCTTPGFTPGTFRESSCGIVSPPTAAVQRSATIPLDPVNGRRVASDASITFFGSARLSQRFGDWELGLDYSRRQSTASGAGSANSFDRARLQLDWEPQRLWAAYAAVGWDRRAALNKITVIADYDIANVGGTPTRVNAIPGVQDRNIDNNAVTAILGTRRTFTRQLRGTFEARYRFQDRNETFRTGDGNVHTAVLLFILDWESKPIRIPDWPRL